MNYNSEGKCHYALLMILILKNIIMLVYIYINIYTCSLLEILGYKQGNNLKQVLLRSMFSMTLSSIVMLWGKKVVNFEALLISTFK